MCKQSFWQAELLDSKFQNLLFFVIFFTTLHPTLLLASNSILGSPFDLESLTASEFVPLTKAFEDKDVIMLFQPDCSACKAQIQNLNCLNSVKLLGTHGTKERLKDEYIRFKSSYPAFRISTKDLQALSPKLKIVTPQFFQVDKGSLDTLRLRNLGFGLKKCEALQSLLRK